MPPNQTLIKDYSTFGDLTQRDLYHRHRTQTIKQGAVENSFYHIDAANAVVETVVEKVTFSTSSNVSTYEVYTKPTSGNIDASANASMLQITTAKTSVRSVLFEANNVNFGNLAASGNASITGTLGVTGNTSLTNVQASGDADITGTLDVTGATTLTTLGTSGLATMNTATVTGATSLASVTASGNAAITGTLGVTGNTSLTNVAIIGTLGVTGNTTIALGTGGSLVVTGAGNVNLGGNDLFNSGNVYFTGRTTIANLIMTGNSSSFAGDLDMSNNSVINVATLTRDNVRVSLDNTSRTIALQTYTGSSWESSVTVAQNAVTVSKDLSATSSLTVDGNLTCTGSSVNFGGGGATTNLTVFGNLEIKGVTTNTRIESNVVQVGDLNVELGFLEINSLSNLNGAGITIGGAGGSIAARPELVYNHSLTAWQPNIDIVTKSSVATNIARMDTDGHFISSSVANSNIFTQVDSTSVNFGNKWRFHHDVANDAVELQHYEGSTWVPKFSYTA